MRKIIDQLVRDGYLIPDPDGSGWNCIDGGWIGRNAINKETIFYFRNIVKRYNLK